MSLSKTESSTSVRSLLHFPVEIQTQIYRHYYCQPWKFYARKHHFVSGLPRKQPYNDSLRNPSINLLLTCRDIYKIASPMLLEFYNNTVSLVAVEDFSDLRDWTVFLSSCRRMVMAATIFYIRLDQAEHFTGWELLDDLQALEPQTLKNIVLEDQFTVKTARSFTCKRSKQTQQVIRLPKRLVSEVVEARYNSADSWAYNTWRRDYNWRHLRYPVRLFYLIRFRVDRLDLRNKIFEVEMELILDESMDLDWEQWIIQREAVREVGQDICESEQWDVVDLDDIRGVELDSDGVERNENGYEARLPIIRARDVKFE